MEKHKLKKIQLLDQMIKQHEEKKAKFLQELVNDIKALKIHMEILKRTI